MSTIVYQEVSQSSLSFKLSTPSKLIFSSSTVTSYSNNNYNDKYGWSAIEALSCSQKNEPETQYVHPLAKRSSYSKFMSEKSLEMCTESLGSETGVFFPESTLHISTTTAAAAAARTASTTFATNNSNSNNRKPWCPSNKGYEFPPPLTTMRGSNSLQVRPYREDGRLVIEAVSAPSSNSCLKVERSDGRLRLLLVRDDQDDNEEEEENEAETETAVSMEGNFGIDIDEEEGGKERKEEKEKEEEEGVVEGKELGGVKLGEDMDGIRVMFGGKMGIGEQFQRPNNTSCRCKEGGRGNIKRLINWEPFWVAT